MKTIEQQLAKVQKAKERKEKRKKYKLPAPSYKGYLLRNWLVFPLGVISVELELAEARRYKALEFTKEKAEEIISKYLVKVCDWSDETGELSFCTTWNMPWMRRAKRRDKMWCKKFDKLISEYLLDNYELPGFTKTVEEDCWGCREWCVFTKQ